MYLLFDIGGTKTRVSVSSDGKTLGEVVIIPTSQDFKHGIAELRKSKEELARGKKIETVIGGVPGRLDKGKVKMVGAQNLPGWRGKPLKAQLEKALNAEVFLENDADLAGLGEAMEGAGRGYAIVAYLTISTGVGGARIVDGHIDANSLGFEPGTQIIEEGKDLESYIGGASLEARYKRPPAMIDDPKIWENIEKFLAYGLVNSIALWSPEVLVVGGGIMQKESGISLARVSERLKQLLPRLPELPPLKKGLLGDKAGLHGALIFLNQELQSFTEEV